MVKSAQASYPLPMAAPRHLSFDDQGMTARRLALAALLTTLAAPTGCAEPGAPGSPAIAPGRAPAAQASSDAPAEASSRPAGCAVAIAPTSSIIPAGGATRRLSVKVNAGCAWQVEGGADWIRLEGASGRGDGQATLTITENKKPGPRTATLKAGGQRLSLFQDGERTVVHPRLWVNPEGVERLKGWARDDNPAYRSFQIALKSAIKDYDSRFVTGKWADNGGVTFSSDVSEAYAEFFAFASLIAKTDEAKDDAVRRARTLLMFVIDKAAPGPKDGVPFRDLGFSTHDRGSWWGESFGLTVDWIYPYLSAQDKAKIRPVLLRWAAATLQTANAPWLIKRDSRTSLRGAANNYYLAHLRNLTLMSLALDPADDPPVDPAKPRSAIGNSLESYFNEVTDNWLPPMNELWKDGGDVSGGLPAEGFLYGTALGHMHQALLAMHTAGRSPPIGQSLISSAYWDRLLAGFLHSIGPAPKLVPNEAYMGPVYPIMNYGDVLRLWAIPEWIGLFASLGIYDASAGNANRAQISRWIAMNALEGGAEKLGDRIGNIWGNSKATAAILSFMLFDPGAPPPADPRPGLPLAFQDRVLGRILARSDWGPNATWFDFGCVWKTIPHQCGDCGQFDMYRKGEWLTKERGGYSNNGTIATTDYHNSLSLQNNRLGPSDMSWFEPPINQRGSQYILGLGMGDPVFRASSGPVFLHAEADMTGLYNRVANYGQPAIASDIEHASRAIVWMSPDHVVIYDRATSRTAGRFKRFNLMFPDEPVITGHTATAKTASGQQIFLQSLLPAAAKISRSPDEPDQTANGEVMRVRLIVEDPAGPSDVRFLHVLEGADAGATRAPAERFRTAGAEPFDGVLVRGAAVLFPFKPIPAGGFKGLSYAVPASIKDHLITGLPPGSYDVSQKASGSRVEISITAGAAIKADEAGGIAFGKVKP